jgi:DNA-binding FrmR family transcriptional regulator
MAHTIRDKGKLLKRVRRIRGQIDLVERLLENEADCGATLQQIAAARGAMNGLMSEVLEEHVRAHLLAGSAAERAEAADKFVDVVRTYLK